MDTFPSSLGSCTSSYTITPRAQAKREEMDSGMTKTVSMWSKPIVDISVEWSFDQTQLATFETFYRDTIKNGTIPFTMSDLVIFGDYQAHDVRFVEHPSQNYEDWMNWAVTGTLESIDYGLMTEAAMNAALGEEPVAGRTTWPFGNPTNSMSVEQRDVLARGNIDGGAFTMAKRVGHLSMTDVSLTYEMTLSDMNLFFAWGWYKLNKFRKWFYAEIPYRGGRQTVHCRMTEPPSASYAGSNNGDGLWNVTFKVEVYERNYLPLADCQTLLPPSTATGAYLNITTQPESWSGSLGSEVVLTVVAESDLAMTYQWYFNGSKIIGATLASYTIAAVAEENEGEYYVKVANSMGYIRSVTVTVAIQVVEYGLYAMGYNNHGQLGDGTSGTDRATPILITTGVASCAGGSNHTLYITTGGNLYGMGWDYYGQLGDGGGSDKLSPILIAPNVAKVAAGARHTLYVTTSGDLYAMGYNSHGQLGDGTTDTRLTPVFISSGVSLVAAGDYHSLFVKTNGSLYAMGYNLYGQLGDGTSETDRLTPVLITTSVASVTAGDYHSLFVKVSGHLYGMGYDYYGQLGDGGGSNKLSPILIAEGVSAVSAGGSHTLWVSNTGNLYGMGENTGGQLGDGTMINRKYSVLLSNSVISISAGGEHSLYVTSDGHLHATGWRDHGQLGDGVIGSAIATPIITDSDVVVAIAGEDHSFYIK